MLSMVAVALGDVEVVRRKRHLIPNKDAEFVVYEGEPVTLRCTKSNTDAAGGEPYLVVGGSSSTIPKPTFTTDRPNTYTVEANITMPKVFEPYKLSCRNSSSGPEESWDKLFQFKVRYLSLIAGKSLTGNKVRVTADDSITSINARDGWVDRDDMQWNVEYWWTGDAVSDESAKTPGINNFMLYLKRGEFTGVRHAKCHLRAEGDTGGYTEQTIEYEVTYDTVSSAAGIQISITVLFAALFAALFAHSFRN